MEETTIQKAWNALFEDLERVVENYNSARERGVNSSNKSVVSKPDHLAGDIEALCNASSSLLRIQQNYENYDRGVDK